MKQNDTISHLSLSLRELILQRREKLTDLISFMRRRQTVTTNILKRLDTLAQLDLLWAEQEDSYQGLPLLIKKIENEELLLLNSLQSCSPFWCEYLKCIEYLNELEDIKLCLEHLKK